MMQLFTIKKKLKQSIDTIFTGPDENMDSKYDAYIACLRIGKFRG